MSTHTDNDRLITRRAEAQTGAEKKYLHPTVAYLFCLLLPIEFQFQCTALFALLIKFIMS